MVMVFVCGLLLIANEIERKSILYTLLSSAKHQQHKGFGNNGFKMEDSAVSIKHTSTTTATIQTKMCATIVTNILLYSVNKEVWEILRMNVQGKHYT